MHLIGRRKTTSHKRLIPYSLHTHLFSVAVLGWNRAAIAFRDFGFALQFSVGPNSVTVIIIRYETNRHHQARSGYLFTAIYHHTVSCYYVACSQWAQSPTAITGPTKYTLESCTGAVMWILARFPRVSRGCGDEEQPQCRVGAGMLQNTEIRRCLGTVSRVSLWVRYVCLSVPTQGYNLTRNSAITNKPHD